MNCQRDNFKHIHKEFHTFHGQEGGLLPGFLRSASKSLRTLGSLRLLTTKNRLDVVKTATPVE